MRAGFPRALDHCLLANRFVFVSALILCAPLSAHAQDAADKTSRIVRATTPPVIDGKLDDAVWQTAPLIDDFHQVRPSDGGAAVRARPRCVCSTTTTISTSARACYDSEPDEITRNVMRHGNALGPRRSARGRHRPVQHGPQRLSLRDERERRAARHALHEHQRAAARLDRHLGDADAASTRPAGRSRWRSRSSRCRSIRTSTPGASTSRAAFAGAARRWCGCRATAPTTRASWGMSPGFSGMDQGVGLDVVPSASANRRRTFRRPARRRRDDTDDEPVARRVLSPHAVAERVADVNTDFSATEIDDRQVNLTRFNLFFPEKRDFFLNDSDLFEFGRIGRRHERARRTRASSQSGRPFFSRRLGLSATGEPVDIEYGGKLSGRVGRFSIGTLAVHQDEFGERRLPRRMTSSDETLLVGRVAADVLGESTLGMVFDRRRSALERRQLARRRRLSVLEHAPAGRSHARSRGVVSADRHAGARRRRRCVRRRRQHAERRGLARRRLAEGARRELRPALGFVSRTGVRDNFAASRLHALRRRRRIFADASRAASTSSA